MEKQVYHLFCGRCGDPKPKLRPKHTLRVRFLRVDEGGVLYVDCICEVCLAHIEIPWTPEEHDQAVQEVREASVLTEDEIDKFVNELDQMGFTDDEED